MIFFLKATLFYSPSPMNTKKPRAVKKKKVTDDDGTSPYYQTDTLKTKKTLEVDIDFQRKSLDTTQYRHHSDSDDRASIDRVYQNSDEEDDDDEEEGIIYDIIDDNEDSSIIDTNNTMMVNEHYMEEQLLIPDITTLSAKEAISRYHILGERWSPPEGEMLTDLEFSMRLAQNFGVDLQDLQQMEIDQRYEDFRIEIESVANRIQSGKREIGEEQALHLVHDLNKMLHQCKATYELLSAMYRQKTTAKTEAEVQDRHEHLIAEKKLALDPKQKLLDYLYDQASLRLLRKYGSQLYEPIYTKEGHYTHAFKFYMDIAKFVPARCHRKLMSENWRYVTQDKRGTRRQFRDLAESLEDLCDPQLPDMKRDRHKFSFRNGVLQTRVIIENNETGERLVTHKFYPYKDPSIREVNSRLVSAKYFDIDYPDYDDVEDWYDIPTPTLQYILNYQYASRDDCDDISRFMYMCIGRMMFDRGDLEKWEFMVMILGIAGTGKSTIVDHVVKLFYDELNIAVISNSIETQFGIGGILKTVKQIFVTLSGELDKTCQLARTTMLQLVDGTTITSAMKNGSPEKTMWPSHWMSAGNAFPAAWTDIGGSITRRIMIFQFLKQIKEKDKNTSLDKMLKKELPLIMQKSVRAYHWYVNRYGYYGAATSKAVKSFCPPYFTGTSEALANLTNHLRQYVVASGRIIIASHLVISEQDLFNDYREYCRSNGIPHDLSNKEIAYETLVQQLSEATGVNLKYESKTNFVYEGTNHFTPQDYFFGMGLSAKLTTEEKQDIYERKLELEEEENGSDVEVDEVDGSDADADEEDGSDAEADEEDGSDEPLLKNEKRFF